MEQSFFTGVFTPLMLVSASLLVMLTARNANLSDRVRGAARLINDDHPDMDMLRRVNLLDQIDQFRQRYIFNELAVGALACALLLFLLMNLFAGSRSLTPATILFYSGLTAVGFAFVLTGADIRRGMATLDLEVQYAKRLYKPDATHQDALKQQLVHWLQTDPEYAQIAREAVQEAQPTAPADNSTA